MIRRELVALESDAGDSGWVSGTGTRCGWFVSSVAGENCCCELECVCQKPTEEGCSTEAPLVLQCHSEADHEVVNWFSGEGVSQLCVCVLKGRWFLSVQSQPGCPASLKDKLQGVLVGWCTALSLSSLQPCPGCLWIHCDGNVNTPIPLHTWTHVNVSVQLMVEHWHTTISH